ncbi:MAG TPA: BlaB/IND/MUS family subclass B1 metallo-beta-lactamase [Chitinophagaceae bacterium]
MYKPGFAVSCSLIMVLLATFPAMPQGNQQGAAGDSADTARLRISNLSGDFYVYTTYHMYKGNRIGANAMYLLTDQGAVLFDTPWDTTQFQPLLDSIRVRHNAKVLLCISTHFHEDRTGGLEYYRKQGIKTYTTVRTDELSRQRGMKRAGFLVLNDSLFNVGRYSFRTYYPGPGHTPDNIVIWFPKEKILYGGCLVKSVQDSDLGNLADADRERYAATIDNLRRECRDPRFVITGHNDYSSTQSLDHTLKMAEELRKGR